MKNLLDFSHFLVEHIQIPVVDTKSKPPAGERHLVGGPALPITWNPQVPEIGLDSQNRVWRAFGGDVTSLKGFLQDLLPNQNLRFLGVGWFGLAFEPRNGGLKLPDSFTEQGFVGQPSPENQRVVIKVTTNPKEAKTIRSLIEEKGGKSPNLCRYYWIKEVELPSDQQFSKFLGPPSKSGMTKDQRQEEILKKNTDAFWQTPEELRDKFQLSPNQRAEAVKKMDKFTQLNKKQGEGKLEKLYLVCLERVDKLDRKQTDHLEAAFNYFYWANFEHGKENVKGYRRFKPISVLRNNYVPSPDSFLKSGKDKRPNIMSEWWMRRLKENSKRTRNTEQIKNFPDYEEFKEVFLQLLDAIEEVYGGKFKPKQLDLHPGNVGYRENNLVFFDPFA